MSDKEARLYIMKEVEKIVKASDIATMKEFMKYRHIFPEIVEKYQESRKCKNAHERWMMSLDILKMVLELRQRNRK